MKIAIMQPAFIPPASYFRLFSESDIFVLYDDAQFNRRWFTHRQKLTRRDGRKYWLTLPIKKCPRETLIKDLEWADNAVKKFADECRRFPVFESESFLVEACRLAPQFESPIKFLESFLSLACERLKINKRIIKSSDLNIEGNGQDKIINICKTLHASEYINSPGGRDLYDPKAFASEDIKLTFLPDVKENDSIIEI